MEPAAGGDSEITRDACRLAVSCIDDREKQRSSLRQFAFSQAVGQKVAERSVGQVGPASPLGVGTRLEQGSRMAFKSSGSSQQNWPPSAGAGKGVVSSPISGYRCGRSR